MKKRRILSLLLTLSLLGSLTIPASAGQLAKVGEAAAVSAGGYHSAVVDKSGTLWVCGANDQGQVGNDGAADSNFHAAQDSIAQIEPVAVLTDVASVDCGFQYTAAVKKDGTLWMWGEGYGKKPVKVMDGIAAVSCGVSVTAVIKSDGTLWTWTGNKSADAKKMLEGVKAVYCSGSDHCAAICTDGSLWTWGANNERGSLGNGTTRAATTPQKILEDVVDVSLGSRSLAVKEDGTLWGWGDICGWIGQGNSTVSDYDLGTDTEYSISVQTVPVSISSLGQVSGVGCNGNAVVTAAGDLYMMGSNYTGEVGNGSVKDVTKPVKVLSGVTGVWGGYHHTLAQKSDGTLWGWGLNNDGQLGMLNEGNEYNADLTTRVHTVPVALDKLTQRKNGNGAVAPAPVEKDTPTLAIETLETFAKKQSADKGYFFLDFDKDGVAELVMVSGSPWGDGSESAVVYRYDNGTARAVTGYPHDDMGDFHNDTLESSFGGSGGTNASIIRFKDGTYGFESKTFGSYRDSNGLRGRYSQGKITSTKDTGTSIYDLAQWSTLPGKFDLYTKPAAQTPVAYASTQKVLVDGKAIEFQCYALKDANGNDTNYIKLRDIASVLSGTAVQFEVGWNGAVNIETGKPYTTNGSEMKTPFSGNRTYENAAAVTNINGKAAALEAIVLRDDKGGAYTYYKLRDLGTALGFQVSWSSEKGIFIETK